MFLRELSMRLSFANSRLSGFYLLSISFLFLSLSEISAQKDTIYSNPILFHGIVIDVVTQNPIEGVQYFSDRQASTDSRGLFSFYAHNRDTVVFSCTGYRDMNFIVPDTLHGNEYAMGIYMNPDTLYIGEVVILPRIGNIRAEILSSRPAPDIETINATNNLKISAYQGIVGMNKLGDPATNYEVLRQKQRMDAYEKGGIPSDRMVSLNPFMAIPIIYMLIKGPPKNPDPPTPSLSTKELQEIKEIHQATISNKKK